VWALESVGDSSTSELEAVPSHRAHGPRKRANVSVVIPCYRCGKTLGRAVASVAGQTVLPLEMILVDDVSGDDTQDEARRLAKGVPFPVRVVTLPTNSGPGAARNEGWRLAEGDWVAFLDADDSWHPEKLERVVRAIEEHLDADAIGHLTGLHRDGVVRPYTCTADGSTQCIGVSQILRGNVVSTPAVVVRRSIPERFPARYFAEDYELWTELVLRGRKFVMVREVLAFTHKLDWGAGGLSADLWAMERAELEMYKALRQKGLVSPGLRCLLSGWSIAKHCRRLILRPFRTARK